MSTRGIPRAFVLVTAALLVLRVVVQLAGVGGGPPEQLVAWRKLTDARRDGDRPLLVYVSAPWCRPCQRLDGEFFRDAEDAALVEGRFEPVRIVVDGDEALTPEEQALLETHGIRGYPTLVVIRRDGTSTASTGYGGPGRVRRFLEAEAVTTARGRDAR